MLPEPLAATTSRTSLLRSSGSTPTKIRFENFLNWVRVRERPISKAPTDEAFKFKIFRAVENIGETFVKQSSSFLKKSEPKLSLQNTEDEIIIFGLVALIRLEQNA